MKIHQRSLNWFMSIIRRGQHFALPGYSDAEWYCMMGFRPYEKTGLGQILCPKHGQRLIDVMRKRQGEKRWLWAVPKMLYDLPLLEGDVIDKFLWAHSLVIKAYERDMILDDAARDAELYPLIKQLQEMDTVIIGPKQLSKLDFLDPKRHVPISTPNLHMEKNGIEEVVDSLRQFTHQNSGLVYLISAGVSAPIIIDRLFSFNQRNWYLDCGSIWDAFVGLGAQREWRAKLYMSDPSVLETWKEKNINGPKSPRK